VEDVPPGEDAPVGCNVWIALTPVRKQDGGGLAVRNPTPYTLHPTPYALHPKP
jgi:hypothetical protein